MSSYTDNCGHISSVVYPREKEKFDIPLNHQWVIVLVLRIYMLRASVELSNFNEKSVTYA